jgi:glycine cleavage system H protein
MKIDANARYTETHEWVRKEGDLLVYGITDRAQDALSDIVYVELPGVGEKFSKGDTIGTVESVKAASDLYIPVDGEITEVNETLSASPELVNSDPFGEGWMVKFKPTNPGDIESLLSPEAYEQIPAE